MPEPLTEPTDVQLMARIQEGSAEAFGMLFQRFGGQAYRVALGIAHDAPLAEDVAQDAFLSIWRNAEHYRPERGSARAWVLGIVRNRAIDALRRHGRHDRRRVDAAQLDEHAHAPSVEQTILQRDQAERLRDTLALLPETQREVIALAYFGQLSVAEIAGELSLPLGTVKGRMRLGLGKLRARESFYAPR